MQLEWKLDWIQIPKLNSIKLNTTSFSFRFNMVRIFSGISIQLNLVKLNQIQFLKNCWNEFVWLFCWVMKLWNSTKLRKINDEKGTC